MNLLVLRVTIQRTYIGNRRLEKGEVCPPILTIAALCQVFLDTDIRGAEAPGIPLNSLSGAGFTNRATVEGYTGATASEWPEGLSFSSGYIYTPSESTNEFVLENTAESGMVSFTYVKVSFKSNQTGINGISSDNEAPVEYFNLNGVRVSNPADGLYIRRQGSKVSKVVIK